MKLISDISAGNDAKKENNADYHFQKSREYLETVVRYCEMARTSQSRDIYEVAAIKALGAAEQAYAQFRIFFRYENNGSAADLLPDTPVGESRAEAKNNAVLMREQFGEMSRDQRQMLCNDTRQILQHTEELAQAILINLNIASPREYLAIAKQMLSLRDNVRSGAVRASASRDAFSVEKGAASLLYLR